ncbi:MAG: EAL domain-containing protein [Siculibacillus sp.]|nr:EAL domain-containing protein [Siculibacillus sp.]
MSASVIVGFFLLALAGLALSRTYGEIAAFWPASAFAAVVMWRNPGVPTGVTLAGIGIAGVASTMAFGTSPGLAAILGVADALEVAVAFVGLRMLGERRIDRSIAVFFGALAIVGAIAPLFGATIGAAGVGWMLGGDFRSVWSTWWIGNALGAALVLPVAGSATRRRLVEILDGRALAEAVLLTLAAGAAVFVTVTRVGQPNLLMAVPVLIAAVRLNPFAAGVLGSATVVSVVGASLLGLVTSGHGPSVFLAPWSSAAVLLPYSISLLIDELARERERLAASEHHFRVAMDRSPFGMVLLDTRGRCSAVNRALCEFLGYEPADIIGHTPAEFTVGDDRDRIAERMKRLLSGEIDDYSLEKQFRHKDGHPVWTFIAVSLVRDEKTGEPLYMIAQMEDMSDRKAAEAALEESESRWNFALESAGQGVWDHDYGRRDTFYSPMWARMLGYEPDEVSTEADGWLALVHPHDLPRLLNQEKIHLSGESEQFECEFRMRHKDGRWLWILDRGKVIGRDAAGRPLRMIGTHTDITEHRLLNEALEEEKERLRITLHSIGDGVVCTDASGLVTFMNPVAEQLTGWSAGAALERPVDIVVRLVDERDDRPIEGTVAQCLSRLDRVSREEGAVLVGRDGSRVDVKASASPVRTPTGEVLGAVLVFQDVTRARTLQKELAQMARQDALTGLPNRTAFEHALAEFCTSASVEKAEHVLCFLDLDRFKIVNDTAGHAAGDALLREVGRVIREHMRRQDRIARLGGDEFGILLTDCGEEDARRIAERLLERIGRVRFSWDGRVYEVGASIGLARIDDGTPLAADVMSRADVACYAAKAGGRNRVSVYHPSEGDARRHHHELHTAAGIRAALDADRFVVHAQEILDLRPAGHLQRHCEILVRMRDEDGELLSPGAFIPAAERYGLMAAIDRWVIRHVLHAHGAAILAVPRLSVSINLSANSLEDPGLVEFLAAELERSALPPHRLRFEITETSLINNLTNAARLVAELRAAGYAIMLDDFGAGVSSFAYLEHFPTDYLKIDGGFVRKMKVNPIDRAIVESINDIGHKIGAVTVAEFVEDEETLEILREIGLDMAQGYHIAEPIPLETLLLNCAAADARLVAGLRD